MGAVLAFFSHLGQKANPNNTKEQHLINIANLNYCGIMKSPFEFYSGKYQHALEQLSKNFEKLRHLYTPWAEDKTFAWQFAKLDKKIKEGRYCPFYDINVGIQNGKFVSRKRFEEIWELKMQQQQVLTKSKFEGVERKQAFIFDLLAFHTLLFHVFKILDVNDAPKCSTQTYLKEYTPFFAQSFLDEKSKLLQFKRGLEASYADIVFVQQPDQLLIEDFKKFQNHYFTSISPDKDTVIFAKKSRFNHQKQAKPLLDRLTPEEYKLLDWNTHTSIMFLDNYMLINGHLNSKKQQNAADVKDLVKIMPIIMQKFLDFDIICGMDANSYIAPFNERIHMFPNQADQFTSIKKRTSMQVQSSKSEKMIKELKDAVMTTLPIQQKFVYTIDGREPSQSEFLPLDDHPFDHYLVFVVVDDHRK